MNVMQLKAKIKAFAKKNNISAQAVLQSYMFEKFLERISRSKYKDKFVLKGGILISSIVGINSRTTMDMDATLKNYPMSEKSIKKSLEDICALDLDDITFSFLNIEPIRDDDEYGGFRCSLMAEYKTIKTPLKVDITAGDAITPKEIFYKYDTIFGDTFNILAYNIETVLAEKYETILRRNVLNTRPRDFYDVYILMKTQGQNIDKKILKEAIVATSAKRLSSGLLKNKDSILEEIKEDVVMRQRWEKYCRDYFYAEGIGFDEVIGVLRDV